MNPDLEIDLEGKKILFEKEKKISNANWIDYFYHLIKC
jgi:hypothetical protein